MRWCSSRASGVACSSLTALILPVAADTPRSPIPGAALVRTVIVAEPDLTRLDVARTRGPLVLLLHGGKERSDEPVDGRSASWRRMAAIQRAVTPAAHEAGASTWLLRYQVRGWNGGAPTADARWALDEVRRELGDIPVVLLGHSMGGRTAVHVADDPSVVGVVALAPWFPKGETVEALAGKTLRAAHGSADKITSSRATAGLRRARPAEGADATFTDMGRVGPLHVPPGLRVERVRHRAVARGDRRHRPRPDPRSVQTGRQIEKSIWPEWPSVVPCSG